MWPLNRRPLRHVDLPRLDAQILLLWGGRHSWEVRYLQDQSVRELRCTFRFHSEIQTRETTIPTATLEGLVEPLRTIVMPVYAEPDEFTVGFSYGNGFRYNRGLQSVGFSWDRPPHEWAPVVDWHRQTRDSLARLCS
jgi:hypothetical protein